ncbi:MAG: tetratricopeptide repeat protein [Planctomycetota bacterium]|jgi:tetratricopeptide (TPR) repeat protein
MRSVTLVAMLVAMLAAATWAPAAEVSAQEGAAGDPAAGVEATSLLGEPLVRPGLDAELRAKREADLAEARARLEAEPKDEDAVIWVGRRLAYLGRYRDAVDVFTRGLEMHPDSHRLLRHRGHRFITLRRLDEAVDDLMRAARIIGRGVKDEVEPDGLPNARNIPLSTSHTNVFYHLGLARYLQGDFPKAAATYRRCLVFAENDDMWCAASYWLYLSLRRAGRDREASEVLAKIHAEMEIIENFSYWRLLRLFKGELKPGDVTGDEASAVGAAVENATVAYGLAAWDLLEGRSDEADAAFRRIVEAGRASGGWAAFGAIAAEAELARDR